jgi:hypothetical protein
MTAGCALRSSTASQARDGIASRTMVLDHVPAASPVPDGLQDKEAA